MKDIIKEAFPSGEIKLKSVLLEVLKQALFLVGGLLLSRGAVFGSLYPFGLAFLAAAPMEYLAATAFGCVVGSLLPLGEVNYFRYLAAVFAIIAIKTLLCVITKQVARPLFAAITAGVVATVTGLVSAAGDTLNTLMALAEAGLAFAGAFFLASSLRSVKRGRGLTSPELACAIISVNILLVSFMNLSLGGISIGKLLACTFLLLISRFGHSATGAICGTVAGFTVALSGGGLAAAVSFGIGGLIGGLFASFGKYAQVTAFILAITAASSVGGSLAQTAELLVVSLFGSAIYLMLPKTLAMRLSGIFSPPAHTTTEDNVKKRVTMRLGFAAGALSDVSQTVETVAKELSRINSPDFNWVLQGVEKEACSGCSLCINCWETKRSDTVSDLLEIIKGIREGDDREGPTLPENLRGRCLRPARLCDAVYKYYSDYASRMAAESRISDLRSVVSEQFDGISSMLKDMATELEDEEVFDENTATKIAEALKSIDLCVEECCCRVDRYGRLGVELIAQTTSGLRYNRMKLLRQIELCCDRDFDPPLINESGGRVYVTLTEKAVLKVKSGACQLAFSPTGVCGDAFSTFLDRKGRFIMVLSDGMGTGGRAAVDGAMASGLMTRLLKAGFGFDCSLNILNSAMLFKSTDESLATVDIACIDLYSGRTEMLKAGAAPTIIRRSGKCGVASSTSLPVGILREVGFDKATVKLRPGDLLVQVSDGATADGTDWLCAELEKWQDPDPNLLAEHLAHCAKRRRQGDRCDDITVVAAVVERAF